MFLDVWVLLVFFVHKVRDLRADFRALLSCVHFCSNYQYFLAPMIVGWFVSVKETSVQIQDKFKIGSS